MRQQSVLVTLSVNQHSVVEKFFKKITKRKEFYHKFRIVLEKSFHEVMKEEENYCRGCGLKFIGKSIGPHYKNSKQCAQKKRMIQRGELPVPRTPLEETHTNNQEQVLPVVPLPKREEEVKEEEGKGTGASYDQLNEYFDSF